jgi:hypothetical protein
VIVGEVRPVTVAVSLSDCAAVMLAAEIPSEVVEVACANETVCAALVLARTLPLPP